jgi:LuxR family maltose regulon positive regulatory protein
VAAARWWSTHGDTDLAIGHAAAADDADLLESLVLEHCGPYAARGMYRTLERWLEYFSEDHIRDSLPLKQVRALLHIGFGNGEEALGWTRLCRSEPGGSDGMAGNDSDLVALHSDALWVTLENRPARELVPVARETYRRLPHGEWRALTSIVLGANLYLCGEEGAIDLMREALFEAEVADSTTLQASAAAALAIVVDIEGAHDEAATLSDRATRMLATPLGRDASTTALSLAIASLVDARSGRDGALSRRDIGREKLERFDRTTPWFCILGLIPLVRSSLLLDDAPGALDLLHRLDSRMKIQDTETPLARYVVALGDSVRAANDAFAARSWSLTTAELRVVQYLPTNLSLAEIATRLYVSRNTVKSHAAAIYRKLGTTSRADAVDMARAAGLIGDTPSAH